MKKMLITGGSGFLGSRAAKYFAGKYELLTPSHREMDITTAEAVNRVVEAFHPDVILHCAAMSDVGQCKREPEVSWQRNVVGSVNVARAAAAVGAKCLLCSSDQVYFETPDNLYATEKRTAEENGLAANPDAVFLRLSWMYDPIPNKRPDFISQLIPLLSNEETVTYALYDRRGITDVNEVIANMEKAIAIPGGVYDFGASNDKSMYETVARIFAGLGLDTARVKADERSFQDSPRDMTMNLEAINRYGIFFSDTAEAVIRNLLPYKR